MTTLTHHRLLKDPDVQALLALLDATQKDCARLIGGCVRDAILGVAISDIDIATQLTPDQVIAACTQAGFKAVPTGIAHGTVTIVVKGRGIEVTTLRKDIATDGRHATIAFTDDWEADALRRDFTLNTLSCDLQGHVFDPTGRGIEDARAGRILFVGDPDARIKEDYLRILRYFRFVARFGHGVPDGPDLAACARHAKAITQLSAERVWSELKKILGAQDPRKAVTAMATSGVLAVALPEATGLSAFQHLVGLECDAFLETDPLQRLMALLPREEAVVEGLIGRLKLSRAEGDRLLDWAKDRTHLVSYLSARDVRAALYWMGNALYLDRVRLAWAHDPEPRRALGWRTLLAFENGYVAPRFPLTGSHVQAAGARPGPAIGQILREVEDWWVKSDFIDDELSLIERLKAVVQALG
jgi:poly(A) polymerase